MQSNLPIQEFKDKKRLKKYVWAYFVVLIVLLVFASGFFIGAWQSNKVGPSQLVYSIINGSSVDEGEKELDFNLFWQVWNRAKEKYLEQPVSEKDLFYGAIAGTVASLGDPYSVYMNPELTEFFKETVNGNFEGIGAEIGIKNEQLVVIAPLAGTPAQEAGLMAGDAILAIDGLGTTEMTLDFAVSIIRGDKGSEVILTILSEGVTEPRDVTITRDVIVIESIAWEIIEDNIAYIELSHFNEDTGKLFSDVVNDILLEQPDGIILDLRNNPGGYLSAAVEVASLFIDKGEVVVIEEYSSGEQEKYKSLGQAQLKGIKTIVLINQGSASASEILAGALSDHNIAQLVGMKTFGKGSIQDYEEFTDGSSLKLTVANWLTPSGELIEGEGIAPDVEVDLTIDDYNANQDPQLDKAIEMIK